MPAKAASETGNETRIRHVRIADDLWVDTAKKANQDGETISGVLRALMRGYLRGDFKV